MAVVLLVALSGLFWFRYYTRDLPDIGSLAAYAPAATAQLTDRCLKPSVAIPYELIGDRLALALETTERRMPLQISRTMFCTPSKQLTREIAELRAASLIERRFSQREILAIYANRVQLGENLTGVEAASQYFFHKNPNDLDLAEAAMLAALFQSPSLYSPLKHPDRALNRRNEIIDAMAANRSIPKDDAEAAKAERLLSLK